MIKIGHALGGGYFIHRRRHFAYLTAACGAGQGGTCRAAKESRWVVALSAAHQPMAGDSSAEVAFWLRRRSSLPRKCSWRIMIVGREILRTSFLSCVENSPK